MTTCKEFVPELKDRVVLDILTEGTLPALASREYGTRDTDTGGARNGTRHPTQH